MIVIILTITHFCNFGKYRCIHRVREKTIWSFISKHICGHTEHLVAVLTLKGAFLLFHQTASVSLA